MYISTLNTTIYSHGPIFSPQFLRRSLCISPRHRRQQSNWPQFEFTFIFDTEHHWEQCGTISLTDGCRNGPIEFAIISVCVAAFPFKSAHTCHTWVSSEMQLIMGRRAKFEADNIKHSAYSTEPPFTQIRRGPTFSWPFAIDTVMSLRALMKS